MPCRVIEPASLRDCMFRTVPGIVDPSPTVVKLMDTS